MPWRGGSFVDMTAVEVTLASNDHHRMWTATSLAFVVGAVVLAIVGLPPIDLHGPLHYLGIMDPLCGGTRATYALARGDLATVLRYNPGVPLLAIAMIVGCLRSIVGYTAGRWLTVRWRNRRMVWVLAVVALVVLEIRQQLNADLLMAVGIQG